MKHLHIDTPLGAMILVAEGAALRAAAFIDQRNAPAPAAAQCDASDPLLRRAQDELRAFFAGSLQRFSVPLAPHGTEFQRAVWDALARIAAGHTTSYADLARTLGRPRSARAVARAVATNPLLLFIPCHRVLGSDGSLTGFSAGLARKRALLMLEGALRPERQN